MPWSTAGPPLGASAALAAGAGYSSVFIPFWNAFVRLGYLPAIASSSAASWT